MISDQKLSIRLDDLAREMVASERAKLFEAIEVKVAGGVGGAGESKETGGFEDYKLEVRPSGLQLRFNQPTLSSFVTRVCLYVCRRFIRASLLICG